MPTFGVERLRQMLGRGSSVQEQGHLLPTVIDKVVQPPLPEPEIIILEGHPLRYYPGFKEFAGRWNIHAAASGRISLQVDIASARLSVNQQNPQLAILQNEVEVLSAKQVAQREIFESDNGVPKSQKRDSLKLAKRDLRRVRERLDRVSHQEGRAQEAAMTRLEAATASLGELDDKFALRLDGDSFVFYLLEKLRTTPDAVDACLLKYCEKKRFTRREQEIELDTIYFRYFTILRYYDGTDNEKVDITEMFDRAREARRRLLAQNSGRIQDSSRIQRS